MKKWLWFLPIIPLFVVIWLILFISRPLGIRFEDWETYEG